MSAYDFPLVVCEDDPRWQSLFARYSHTGCPGIAFEDVCGSPWECASFGGCARLKRENQTSGNCTGEDQA